jgi:hypothetical protein
VKSDGRRDAGRHKRVLCLLIFLLLVSSLIYLCTRSQAVRGEPMRTITDRTGGADSGRPQKDCLFFWTFL